MDVTLIGTGGPIRHDRACMGLVVEAEGCEPLLIDTGGGLELVRQLHRVGLALADIEHVIVTHRHGDHIGGTMACLLEAGPRRFYGPPDALLGVRELAAATYPEWPPFVEEAFQPVVASRTYGIGGFAVRFYPVVHRVPTFAVRVSQAGRVVAYSADSLPCDALVDCARDADLFVCDALCATDEGEARVARTHELMHPTAREAGEMATRAGARYLALVHPGTPAAPSALLADAARAFAGPITAPPDGTRYRLS